MVKKLKLNLMVSDILNFTGGLFWREQRCNAVRIVLQRQGAGAWE